MDGLHNVLITGAAAEVPLQSVPDFFVAGIRISFQDLCRCHNHSGRAVAALQAVVFPETFLHRMQLAFCSQSFNGGYIRAIGLDREQPMQTALGLVTGAKRAGKRLYYGGYPITPASDILH